MQRGFTDEQTQAHDTLQLVTAIIGFVVSLLGVGLLFYQHRALTRSSGLQLILSLFCCFIIHSLNRLIRYSLQPLPLWDCYIFGPINQLTRCVIFAYELTISLFLYRIVVLNDTDTLQLLPVTHWLLWSWSALLTALPATTSDYWPPDCYLNSATETGRVWMLVTILIPLIIYMLVILILLSIVSYTLLSKQEERLETRRRSVMMLMRIPVIFIVCWIPYMIYRFQVLVQDDNDFALEIAGAVGTGLHPILTVLSFSWTPLVKFVQHFWDSRYVIDG